MTPKDFFNQFNGRYVDFDGAFGNQCVDLVQFYNRDVIGNPARFTGNAKDIISQAGSYYTKTSKPEVGSIGILGAMTGNPYGHIGIVSAVYPDGSYDMLEQNDPTGTPAHFKRYNNANLLGFLKPNKLTEEIPMEEIQKLYKALDQTNKNLDRLYKIVDDTNKNVNNLYNIVDKKTNDISKQISDLYIKLNDTNKRVDKLEKK